VQLLPDAGANASVAERLASLGQSEACRQIIALSRHNSNARKMLPIMIVSTFVRDRHCSPPTAPVDCEFEPVLWLV